MAAGRIVLWGGVGIVMAALASAAFAQEQAEVLKQRQAMMKVIGGNMKALGEIAKGERSEAPADVARRAREINENAKKISVMFKPEVHVGNVGDGLKTTAAERIWQEPQQFGEAANKLDEASMQLAMAADTGDQDKIKAGIGAMAKTCGGCHELYRVKKQ